MFGNITSQPASDDKNGFLALAVFDTPAQGGNDDGIIDRRDAIWPDLLVWIDANHDGISQPEELHHLDDLGIHSIALKYDESRFTDAYGNQFRYEGRLNPVRRDNVGRVIYDVFLTHNAPSATATSDWEMRLKSNWLASVCIAVRGDGVRKQRIAPGPSANLCRPSADSMVACFFHATGGTVLFLSIQLRTDPTVRTMTLVSAPSSFAAL